MNVTEIKTIYLRDIKRLSEEISQYPNDKKLWEIKNLISNSGGNLCLHLVGNLNHFIGATLGNIAYSRNRDAEFNTKDLSKNELLKMIDESKENVTKIFESLNESDLQKEFPFDFAGKYSTEFYLVFFIAHFEYHLGQINYHRRMI